MNCERCWSADAGNSVSVALYPCAPYLALKSATTALPAPVVSFPWQYLTVPLGGLSSDLGSMTFAPLTSRLVPPPLVLDPPPPPPPPLLLLLLLLPQAARTMQQMNTAPNPNLTFIAPPPPDATWPLSKGAPLVRLEPYPAT